MLLGAGGQGGLPGNGSEGSGGEDGKGGGIGGWGDITMDSSEVIARKIAESNAGGWRWW